MLDPCHGGRFPFHSPFSASCRIPAACSCRLDYIGRIQPEPRTGNRMLEIRHVVKTFGKDVRAVDDVSLTLERGVVGLIGHNGAGKTTLMQMIATLTRPTSGQI